MHCGSAQILLPVFFGIYLAHYFCLELIGGRNFSLLDNSRVFKTSFRENISEDEKIAGLSLLWSEVKYNFVSLEKITAKKWDDLYLSYLPRVRQSSSTFEYYLLLQELCAQLRDAHTNVYLPEPLYEQLYARPQIQTRMVEEKVIIINVWDDDLRAKGVKEGLEIISINGIHVRQYAEKYVMPYQSSSTIQDLITRTYEYSLLNGKKGESIELELQDSTGKNSKKVLPRIFTHTSSRPILEFRVLSGNIAYVTLHTFSTREVVKDFASVFATVKASDALILDLRDNDGGNSNIGYDILGYLLDRPFRISNWKTPQYLPVFRAWGKRESWFVSNDNTHLSKTTQTYGRPVVVLTSSRTISAAEDFCVAFDYAKRGVMIGERTAGSTGQPLIIALPGGGTARIRTKHDTYPNGKEFVDVGISPDIEVFPTVNDVRSNRDTVLEAALAYLKNHSK
jgi:carboxyl-terminal processing protease